MNKLCGLIITLLIFGLASLPNSAIAEESVTQLPLKRLIFFKDVRYYNEVLRSFFPARSAKSLMSAREFERYNKALQSFNCQTANDILKRSFVKAYPQFAKVLDIGPITLGVRCKDDCAHWSEYVSNRFEEVYMCPLSNRFERYQKQLEEKAGAVSKYAGEPKMLVEATEEEWVRQQRDFTAYLFVRRSDSDSLMATQKVIELIDRGGIFDASPDVEYFVHLRACKLGADCKAFELRLKKLENKIGNKRAAQVRKQADKIFIYRPKLNDLLLGKKF